MIRKIVLKDFMSHQNTVIELSDGVTVISGPNNVGKSALVEAIRCVCENPPAAFVIRHGASRAVVEIELASGEIIRWERTPASSLYRILEAGGKERIYAKSRNVPEEVRRLLRIRPVETGSGRLDVHLAHQKEPVFLLDESGSKIAGFFAASTEAEYLIRMRQVLKEKTRFYQEKKSELESEIEEYRALLEAYRPLDELEGRVFECAAMYEAIANWDRKIEVLGTLLDELEDQKRKILECSQRTDLLLRLESPPDINDTDELALMIYNLENAGFRLEELLKEIDLLADVSTPPELKNAASLAELLVETDEITRQLGFNQSLVELLNRLETSPNLQETSSLHSLCSEMDDLMRRIGFLERSLAVYYSVRDLSEFEPTIRDLKDLSETVGQMESLIEKIEALERELTESEKSLALKRDEIGRYLQKIRVCPVCRQVVSLEHFLQEAEDGSV